MEETQQPQTTLLEEVNKYEPNHTLNIADLEYFNIGEPMQTKVFNEGKEDEYKVKVLMREGKNYRVPFLVLEQIKDLLKVKPNLNTFQVIKSGTGKLDTKYQTIPYIIA